jgi:hypothetical protein
MMPDTLTQLDPITDDSFRGTYPRLSPAAIKRAKSLLGTRNLGRLADELGFSRMNFWRVRHGLFDIRYSHALRVAERLGWPVECVFEDGNDA